ncbi:MAG: DUF2085 domain-containing protein [Limisphaerales bacterium]
MSAFYTWACQFGSFVESRKTTLLFSLSLVVPLTALTLSLIAPAFGNSIFSFFCHQNPDRSIGALSLCSRCFGLYLGVGLAGLFAPVFSFRFSKRFLIVGVAASLALAGLSLFSSGFDANYIRLILGVGVGVGAALLIKSLLK